MTSPLTVVIGEQVQKFHLLLARGLHVFHELVALERNGSLARHRLQQAKVVRRELALLFVQHLQDTDDLPFDRANRRANHVPCDIARLFVDARSKRGSLYASLTMAP